MNPMPRVIRIGTRDSDLAMWQAKAVQGQLEYLGHETQLVPLKSTGDIDTDSPIYDMGITGVFTRTLDLALLSDEIDIAVHSLKDVPTNLPGGISQAAVLKRGNPKDLFVYKKNEEFFSQPNAVVATGSPRRKAQWLNRYPTHTVVGLRGNVNTRLEKLENSEWNGAIFAAAGLGRLGLRPSDSFNLDWMVPAPAQGAIMIAARTEDEEMLTICAEINDEETQVCTSMEREFLNKLEGGCSAPIGALAQVKDEELTFQGVLLSLDGSRKIEIEKTVPYGKQKGLIDHCVEYILDRGGKRIMMDLRDLDKTPKIYSTKTLSEEQKKRFKHGIHAESSDFVKISYNRLPLHILKSPLENVIITSKNAVESILSSCPAEELNFGNIYCVGRRTKRLIERKMGKVIHSANNAQDLADYLVNEIQGQQATYFCSNIRLDELPQTLAENKIELKEIVAYETVADPIKLDNSIEGVMFYSPSTIDSYLKVNDADRVAYCIGETTAEEARKHFKDVRVSRIPTVEGVIELVNNEYSKLLANT